MVNYITSIATITLYINQSDTTSVKAVMTPLQILNNATFFTL